MTQYRPEGYTTPPGGYSAAAIHEAMLKGLTLEARALLCDSEHNLHLDLGCMRGIIPREEGALGVREGRVRDIAIISRVNKPVCFKVLETETRSDGVPFAVLSRRAAQQDCLDGYVSALRPGDVIDCTVTHLEPFGAFCDIGCGLSALLPIDCICVSRIPHPASRLNTGLSIKAVVRGRDDLGRITLTHKELLGTWEENASLFSVGETVPGIVRSVESYGIFVELTANLAGLAETGAQVVQGMHCSVFIKSIIPEKMKLKLILVDGFNAEYPEPKMRYFFTGTHMDSFHYSPVCCNRKIETIFGA